MINHIQSPHRSLYRYTSSYSVWKVVVVDIMLLFLFLHLCLLMSAHVLIIIGTRVYSNVVTMSTLYRGLASSVPSEAMGQFPRFHKLKRSPESESDSNHVGGANIVFFHIRLLNVKSATSGNTMYTMGPPVQRSNVLVILLNSNLLGKELCKVTWLLSCE